MPTIPNPFGLVTKAVKAFFTADVKLKKGQRGLQVVLDPRAADGSPATPPPEVAPRDSQELQRMRQSLATLLDEHGSNRQALRHLAFIEHALQRGGLRAFHKVPLDVLSRAHAQLDSLVTNWSDEGLAALRSRMAVAVAERQPPREASPTTAATAREPTEPVARGSDAGAVPDAPLAHPKTLVGDEAAEAEAALLAAYGSVALPGLGLTDDTPEAAPVAAQRESATAH